ncbi:uncharacterized protein DNG_06756 [Cephalotrichum gorgonifer]|uniref:Uncharacterized protein n=1 Tax=Cephalotrichum gorgonifer TaxID=2041049 RepID=A0AAE8N324_9PEZI|nr:uncharacterized protein DNG_06756 [Cephalotrichum gorgonifer]
MPVSGIRSIPWSDPSQTQRLEEDALPILLPDKRLRFTWKFCERTDRPRWGGCFYVAYKNGGGLATGGGTRPPVATLDRPWEFFDPGKTDYAEMDCRTGAGRFKKVMWYHRTLGYGNDVLGQPVEAWSGREKALYTEFVSSFLPQMPCKN